MRKKDYSTTRNSKKNEYFYKFRNAKPGYSSLNAQTIVKLFPQSVLEKMTEWDRMFVLSLKKYKAKWTDKQVSVLRSIESKYNIDVTPVSSQYKLRKKVRR